VPVEIPACAVVVLGGAGVGLSGEDLGIPQRDAGIKEGVCDRGVPHRVRADVPGDAGCLGYANDHPVGAASVDRVAGCRPEDQWPFGSLCAADLEYSEYRDGEGHDGRLVALADEVQDSVPAEGLLVVLDPDGGGLRGAQSVDAEQVGQGAVVDGYGLCDLEESDQLEPIQP